MSEAVTNAVDKDQINVSAPRRQTISFAERLTELFLACYLCYLLLAEVQIVRDKISVIHPVFLVWGFALLLRELLVNYKVALKIPGWRRILLYLFAALLTIFVNRSIQPGNQLKAFALHALVLLPVYGEAYLHFRRCGRHEAFQRVALPALILNFILALTGLLMFLFNYSFTDEFLGAPRHIGLIVTEYGGHKALLLYGLYFDTNHAAPILLATFCLSAYFLVQTTGHGAACKIRRAFHICNMVIVWPCLILANSRGALLSLYVTGSILGFILLYRFFVSRDRTGVRCVCIPLKVLLSSAAILALLIGLLTLIRLVSLVYVQAVPRFEHHLALHETSTTTPKSIVPNDGAEIGFSKGGELGSGRLQLWTDGFTLAVRHPLLGIGTDNHGEFAHRELPSPNSLENGKALHNSYLELLLANGLLGFVAYANFFVPLLFHLLIRICRGSREELLSDSWIFAAILLMLSACFFISDLFTSSSFMYALIMILLAQSLPGLPTVQGLQGRRHKMREQLNV